MSDVREDHQRPAIVRNLTAFRQRLRRVRVPEQTGGSRGTLILAGSAVLAAGLIVLFMLTLDNHSVGWWETLSRSQRRAFDTITQFGKSNWLLIPTGVFCIALLFADWSRTSRRVAAAWIEVGNLVAFFFFSIALAGILTNIIKWMVGRSRPVLFAEDGVFTFTFLSFDYAHVSFPSGHSTTAAAAFIAVALIFRGRRAVIIPVGLAVLAIAVSRVGVRAHFPSDVVAGLFVGGAFTYVYARALGRHGVAFQRQPDGSLMPKTAAIRGMLAHRGGGRAMLAGLRSAWFGHRARDDGAVEKR